MSEKKFSFKRHETSSKSKNIRDNSLESNELEQPSISAASISSFDLDIENASIDTIDTMNFENINDINNQQFIEISQNVSKIYFNREHLNKFNENYGKIQKSIIIALNSHDGHVLLWKTKNIEKLLNLCLIHEIENAEEICVLVKKFIKKSIESDHLGLSEYLIKDDQWMQIKTLDITQLSDSRGYNLLMFAAEVNAVNLIEQLLKIGFTVNDHVKKIFSVDIAWENKNYEIIAILLNHNSRFPDNFHLYSGDFSEFPASLNNFLSFSKEFYNAFDEGDEVKLTELIEKNRNLRHYFNTYNISAPLYALHTKNLHLYEFFTSKDVTFSPFDSTKEIIKTLNSSDRAKIDKIHKNYVKFLPDQHVSVMIANTNLGHDIDKLDEKRSYVEKAFYHLNSIALIQIILKCVAASKKFNIILDFNRSHVQILNPTEEADSNGIFDHSDGRISIAAKQMLDSSTKNDVYGVIAHELCHYAMHIVYRNNCKPYHKGDKANETKFEKISIMCMRHSKKERFIDLVFENYHESVWHTELIVRVPHLTALYHDQPEKLEETRRNFKPLFDYYEEKVVKDIEQALPIIGMREEEKNRKIKREKWILRTFIAFLTISFMIGVKIGYDFYQSTILNNYKWDNLSSNQKSKVLASDFNFQGEKVKINDLLNDTRLDIDPILIRDYLINDKIIEIGKSVDRKRKFYIERQFTSENMTINFNDIINRVENNSLNTFILSDEAGTGKSSTFVNLTAKLKSKFPHKWISYIVLRNHIENFKIYDENESIEEFLSQKILNLTDFESRVFKKLFNDNQVIFLWDGFDEISPTYEIPVLKLLINIKSTQFVSTRTLYTEKLKKSLKTKSHKFIPYNEDDRDDFVIGYAEENEYFIGEAIKSQSHLKKFLKKVKENDENRDIDTLMLEIFLKTLREQLQSNLTDISINFYLLYDSFMKIKYQLYRDKFKNEENLLHRELTNRDHEALALNLVFKDIGIRDIQTNEIFNISSLDIHNKVADIDYASLAKVGIIDLDSKGEYHFGHRTFAEFFIARYLIDKFYNKEEYYPRDEEIILRLNLLFNILNDDNFKITHEFLKDYLRENNVSQWNSLYIKVVEKKFKNIFDYYLLSDESLTFVDRVSNFFTNDPKMLNLF